MVTLVAVVAITATLMVMHRQDELAGGEQQGASNTVQGSITPAGTTPSGQRTASTANEQAAIEPKNANTSTAAPEVTPSPAAIPQTAQAPYAASGTARIEGSSKNQRLLAIALARARTGLEKNDLRMARSGVFWALSLQRDNSDALAMKQELLARERARN
ncbi:hypothetical protein [Paraburkholderia sp. C35]|uniref:hypothetical protein n=1 Tax=Paraburkholderia sp. C35 TaxID=2126993 RepID=UPI0013A53E3E|nr:hypothetical protein [Paraburkholderia sp. C35]